MRCRITTLLFTVLALLMQGQETANANWGECHQTKVRPDRFFTPTGIRAAPNDSIFLKATGAVDLSIHDGGYRTHPDGTILATSPNRFFIGYAGPFGVDPVKGSRKWIPEIKGFPAHLVGAPYGALVAGFTPSMAPSSFRDFPNGFALINTKDIARVSGTGGYLFLGVNNINTSDNGGYFRVTICRRPPRG